MLASRLLSILMLLQTRGRMSASQLAAEFEVAVRTIHRDIDQLSAAGIPIYAERGRSGGFRLQDGYRTKLTGLTQPEAESLFLAGLPGPAAQLGLADILSTARLKLLAALPANIQPGAERIAARFHLDAATWFHSVDQLPSLQLLARAVWSERMLKLRYRRATEIGARPRQLGPLGLVLKGGVWYLVAMNGSNVLTYRASNIYDATICAEAFTRPANFDLAAYWDKASRDYEAGLYREQADVRLSPEGMQKLQLIGPFVAKMAAQTAGKPDSKGWTRCTLPLETSDTGVHQLLRLGTQVIVLGPPGLRAQLAKAAAQIAKNHAAPFVARGPRRKGFKKAGVRR
jgi:predicted DNA-binding transcriptional regulator YafY